MSTRRGFTIVELLVVAVLGTIMLVGALNVLVTNRRVFTVQNSKVTAQQSTRSAMEVLFNELREVSANGGDIVDFADDSLRVRSMRELGVVCDALPATHATTPQLLVRKVIQAFEAGDSIFAFADNDEFLMSDDTWLQGVVTAIDTTVSCPDGSAAQLMTFAGQSAAFKADSVQVGAPIRSFVHVTYSMGTWGAQNFLGRSEAGSAWTPVVGPLRGPSGTPGLEFGFLKSDGTTATTAADIHLVDVMLRSFSPARDAEGGFVVDSLSSRIFMRN